MSRSQHRGDCSTHGPVAAGTFAQVLVGRVIGEPSEFVLDGLGEVRIFNDRILSHLACEFRVKVGDVQYRLLERGAKCIMSTDGRSRRSVHLRHWA